MAVRKDVEDEEGEEEEGKGEGVRREEGREEEGKKKENSKYTYTVGVTLYCLFDLKKGNE